MTEMQRIKNFKNPFNGAPLYYIGETTSTMDLGREFIREDPSGSGGSGSVIAAGFQKSGRGRLPGRIWVSGPGENMLFTLILHKKDIPSEDIPLSLIAGLGLSFYFEESFNLVPSIKWPNDILIGGKKISGVLVQLVQDYYLTGIGINCNQTGFSSEKLCSATSVKGETGTTVDILSGISSVLYSIHRALKIPDRKAEIEKRLYLKGEEVTFLNGDPLENDRITGIVTGLGPNGTLVLQPGSGGGPRLVAAGEMLVQRS